MVSGTQENSTNPELDTQTHNTASFLKVLKLQLIILDGFFSWFLSMLETEMLTWNLEFTLHSLQHVCTTVL